MRQAVMLLGLCGLMSWSWAETIPAQTVTATTATQPPQVSNTRVAGANPNTPSQPNLRQNTPATPVLPANLATLQQKHKQEIEKQNKRLDLLEQANQEALAKNQELQIKNDNLTVQVQVLQSERSAQMFLYGAVTFGAGTLTGIIIYSLLYTRRRRSW